MYVHREDCDMDLDCSCGAADDDLELQAFDADFVAAREAELIAALTTPIPDVDEFDDGLVLHPFGGDP